MWPQLRFLLLSPAALFLASFLAAQSAPQVVNLAPTDPSQSSLSLSSLGWVSTSNLNASLGWCDNVLLSPYSPIGKAFARAEVDTFVWRKFEGNLELISLLNGTVLRYLSPPDETSGEQQWFAHVEGRWQPVKAWGLSLATDAFLQDLVVDLSETEAARLVAPLRAQGLFATLATQICLPGQLRFEPLVQAKRSDYRNYEGDYDELKCGLRLEWKHAERLVLSGSVMQYRRHYSQRAQFTAAGRELVGTRLGFAIREAEAKTALSWKGAGSWTLSTTAGYSENRDEASGFFDYDLRRGKLELTWDSEPWKISLDGDAKRMDYLVQTVGAGVSPEARTADLFEAGLRIERQLGSAWTLFAEDRWEETRSNESGFSYRSNTVLAGAQRAF